jgi:protein TonB
MTLLLAACAVEAPDASLPTEVPAEAVVPQAEMPALEVVPYTTGPQLENRAEVVTALEREYPPLLRDAGIGGTTRVRLFVDERGQATNGIIDVTSGHEALDQAALRVGTQFRFRPALDGDKPVAVWLTIPITFSVH